MPELVLHRNRTQVTPRVLRYEADETLQQHIGRDIGQISSLPHRYLAECVHMSCQGSLVDLLKLAGYALEGNGEGPRADRKPNETKFKYEQAHRR